MAKAQKQKPQLLVFTPQKPQLLVFTPQKPIAWVDRCPRCHEYVGQENLSECSGCGMAVCDGCLVETARDDRCADCAE